MKAKDLSISTKKVVYRGEKCYKILGFSCYNLEDNNLPQSYFKEFPFCFEDNGCLAIATNNKGLCDDNNFVFEVGDYVPKDDFEKALEVIKACGNKLHNINQGIKEMKKEWFGTEDFKI